MLREEDLIAVACPVCGCDTSRHERTLDGYRLTRCDRCGMVFANPRLSPEALLAGYDDHGEHAAEIHRTEDLARYYAERTTPATLGQFDRILREIHRLRPEARRVLDFGCGASYFVQRAAQAGQWDVHGVEIGTWARAEADRRNVENVHIGLLQEQGFEDGAFDVIHSGQVLEHLDAPLEVLAEIRRVLAPGGLFYANVPNYGRLSIRLGRDHFESNRPMGHLSYFTDSTLRRLMIEAGLRPVQTWSYGGMNWENILGRAIEIPEPPTGPGDRDAIRDPFANVAALDLSRPDERGMLRAVAEKVLYDWGKFGIELEIFAEKV